MSNIAMGYAGIVVALLLLVLKIPIGVALGVVSLIGIGMMTSPQVAWGILSTTPFDFVGQWELSAAPMFLLMGYLCSSTNMTEGMFKAMRMILSKVPGSLAVSSVMATTFFSAASGSSVATAAAMARIAVPEMLKNQYDKGLATGTIASAGTLGSLLPPSVLLVLYGVYAQVSVGQLFMAGVLPGLMSAALMMVMIMLRVKYKPSLAGVTANETFSRQERLETLKKIWPLPTLILGVLGGLFIGIFSPTEAGAVGVSIAALIAAARKQLTQLAIRDAVVNTAVSTTSIFIILVGSMFFTRFLAMSGVPGHFSALLLGVSADAWWILLAVAVIYLILGMFVESIGLLLLTLPLVLPLVQGAQMNLVWFGIIVVKLLEIGLLTPPLGLNVYVIKGAMGKSVSLNEIFRGVTWFIVTDLVALLFIILIPALSLYLPQQML